MRDLLALFLHFLTTLARLLGPGGTRAVIAETSLIKHQPMILNRSRRRAPNLTAADRIAKGLCSLFTPPALEAARTMPLVKPPPAIGAADAAGLTRRSASG